jgi:hypothetical protein
MEASMSYPYPQDRHLDRKEKGEQPYKDAKEAMSQTGAQIQSEAEAFGEAHRDETDEERTQRRITEAEDALASVTQELRRSEREG